MIVLKLFHSVNWHDLFNADGYKHNDVRCFELRLNKLSFTNFLFINSKLFYICIQLFHTKSHEYLYKHGEEFHYENDRIIYFSYFYRYDLYLF